MSDYLKTDPYWWDAASPKKITEWPIDSICDVAIVGAGYAGLSAALTLARAGRAVQIFDRQNPGEGASTRNGGIASGNIHMSFQKMTKKFGLEYAKEIYLEGKLARLNLSKFIADERIDCDFHLVGRFTAAFKANHYEAQGEEADFMNKHLGICAYMVPKFDQHKEIATDMYYGGMVRPDIVGLNPAKFHAGLLELARKANVVIHGQTPVTKICKTNDGFEVQTQRGKTITGDIIIATNGYTDNLDKWLRRRLIPVASHLIATEPLPATTVSHLNPKNRMFGETRKLFKYFRSIPDGVRILIGGGDGKSSDNPQRIAIKLKSYLSKIFPELEKINISHSWRGNVAFNMSFFPCLFSRQGINYVTGFCGSGVVWAWWLGQKAGLKLLGDKTTESAFNSKPPMAIPFYNGEPWFLPAAQMWFKLQDKIGATSKK